MKDQSDRQSWIPAGWTLLAFGIADVIRLPVEALLLQEKGPYILVVVLDLAIGIGTIISGWALAQGYGWGWGYALASWGAMVGSSAVFFVYLLPKFLNYLQSDGFSSRPGAITARMILYAITLLGTPYIVWTIVTSPKLERSERVVSVGWMLGASIVAGMLSASIVVF